MQPPASDVLEISVFGTGNGEAIAIHVGGGSWILVDSCVTQDRVEPLSLKYLHEIGVDPSASVKKIVATHWHDDHVAGLGKLLTCCPSADLILSAAAATDEFLRLVGLFSGRSLTFDKEKSGVRELGVCFNLFANEKRNAGNAQRRSPTRAQCDLLLFSNDTCEVVALSPSSETIENAQQEIYRLWESFCADAQPGKNGRLPRRGIPCPERNLNAIVLWVRFGSHRVLLGSDLEVINESQQGWNGVLQSQHLPDGKASAFKIPHHGSPNGHCEAIWDELVEQETISMLTAYNRGKTPRPDKTDIERISKKTSRLYYTSLPSKTSNKYNRTVEKTLVGIAKRRTSLTPRMGHIRLRIHKGGITSIDTFGTARKAVD